ncbi:hypothetical protein SLUN_18740 [Streptomyces lunaelactis]|uniref:Uncharacterized protein n=1 Tax=Streptomyces lunaelactis TaxID=1535768 RepID=A0A2R4T4A5_9ACTN|nr:hypothetical protein [Streptomyces lunaelactis]AVZ73907.1 hypothetical protein SLUN_18740 [Streptomyces lunaelactis]NUK88236.1 hypothetical protein [Streptomyces lunaelactis]
MRTAKKTAALALTAVAALLATTGAASADTGTGTGTGTSTPAPKATPTGDGAQALCKRVPKIDKRLERILSRLDGDVTERGSIARLQKRAENAKKAGHTEIETYLNDKLTFRRTLVPTLEKRQKDLAAVKTWCEANAGGSEK